MKHPEFLIALAICVDPSASYAGPGPAKWAHVTPVPANIQLAQSGIDNLSESELKRISFYADRALQAVSALAAEDAAGAVNSDANVVALRASVSRLVDAGKRSGLTEAEIADFFQLLAEYKFAQDIPLALQGASGKLDTHILFAGVAERSQFGTSGKSTQSYQEQLDAVSSSLTPLDGSAGSGSGGTAVSSPQKLALQAPEDASDAAREIMDRVVMRDGRQVITVAKGDTLARYAAALYGDPLAYRQIYLTNTEILVSPSDLVIGTTLELP
ncbi:MAG: hypothetical protein KAT26_13055 [Marinosulfonomonas sp.]|nr:hypothetical protein [Marinosulfonomonas sp.]